MALTASASETDLDDVERTSPTPSVSSFVADTSPRGGGSKRGEEARGSITVNRREFGRVVDGVLGELPPWVVEQIDNLSVVVEDRPTRDQDPDGHGILGIYEGVSLAERGFDYFGYAPDRIVVFYQPHIELGLPDDELRAEIRVTVLHEIAHHLGIDDERLHELGWD